MRTATRHQMKPEAPEASMTPVAEGLIGAGVGVLIGGGLYLAGLISAPAITGVVAGFGIGSGFNAWRRRRNNKDKLT